MFFFNLNIACHNILTSLNYMYCNIIFISIFPYVTKFFLMLNITYVRNIMISDIEYSSYIEYEISQYEYIIHPAILFVSNIYNVPQQCIAFCWHELRNHRQNKPTTKDLFLTWERLFSHEHTSAVVMKQLQQQQQQQRQQQQQKLDYIGQHISSIRIVCIRREYTSSSLRKHT